MDFLGVKLADGKLSQKLKAVMNQPGIGDQKIEVTALEAFVREVYQDEYRRGRKSKMTWNSNIERPVEESMQVGLWRKDLPYVKLGDYAVIQNRQLLNIGGQPITLDEISDVKHEWLNKQGEKRYAPSDRQTATAAWQKHMTDAIATDPMICDLCGTFRARDTDDRMKHLYHKHPVEFAERVGLETQRTAEVVVSAIPDAEPPVINENGEFTCCGKIYSSLGRLNQHRGASKAHRTE